MAYFNSDEYKANINYLYNKRYHKQITEEFSKNPLLQEDVMTLKDIYVSPSIEIHDTSKQDGVKDGEVVIEDIHSFLQTLLDCTNDGDVLNRFRLRHDVVINRLFIFGYPGQGKSSLSKKLAYDVINGSIRAIKNVYIIPFRYIPKYGVEEFRKNPFKYINNWISEEVYQNNIHNIEKELRHSLLIFDGLDELDIATSYSDSWHEQLLEDIYLFSKSISILVTSRYIDINTSRIGKSFRPLTIELKPFDSRRQKIWLAKINHYGLKVHSMGCD